MRLDFAAIALALSSLLFAGTVEAAPIIWTAPLVEFSKAAFGDPSDEANQDFLTDDVILTRDVTKGIFNIAQESEFEGKGLTSPSPIGTEWAVGKAEDFESLSFQPWAALTEMNPPGLVGQDLTLHLIDDDIYLDLRFTAWGIGSSAGGSFSYVRASVPEPSGTGLLALGLIGLVVRPSRSSGH